MTLSEYIIEAIASRKTGKYKSGPDVLSENSSFDDFTKTIDSISEDAGKININFDDDASMTITMTRIARERKNPVSKVIRTVRYIAISDETMLVNFRFDNRMIINEICAYEYGGLASHAIYRRAVWCKDGRGDSSFGKLMDYVKRISRSK